MNCDDAETRALDGLAVSVATGRAVVDVVDVACGADLPLRDGAAIGPRWAARLVTEGEGEQAVLLRQLEAMQTMLQDLLRELVERMFEAESRVAALERTFKGLERQVAAMDASFGGAR
ncbi:MAG: hypothetical protein NVS3B16_24720 [Vulcanimicrobiaceae bacterium]